MEHEEEMGMSYGSVNPSEIATLSLLGGGVGGFGYGRGGAAETAYTAFQHNDTRNTVREEGDQSANRDAFAAVQTTLQTNRLEGLFFQSHLDNDRKFQALNAQIQANLVETIKCCCAGEKTTMMEGEKTRDLINSQEIDRLRSQLHCANANMAASTNRSVFIGGDAQTSNNSGQIS